MYKLTHLQYFAALKEDILKGLKCLDCGTITVPPKATCDECGSTNQEITQLSGEGTIRTFTVIRVAPEGFKAPYVVVLTQLREGPWPRSWAKPAWAAASPSILRAASSPRAIRWGPRAAPRSMKSLNNSGKSAGPGRWTAPGSA